MTTYELAKTLTHEQVESLTKAGLLAYEEIGKKCFTCEENVRKIVGYMQKEW